MVQPSVHISPVTGGYRLTGSINGTNINLLLDTGAAVTLLREDVWKQLAPKPHSLEPWPGATLVSAGGMPLTVHGCACVNLNLGGRDFKTGMVVVSPLTSEAILGIDFLQGQQAVIDLGCGRLCLKESGCEILLDALPQTLSCTHSQPARTFETVEVPPRCVMEVSAHLETAVEGVVGGRDCVWGLKTCRG